MVTDPLRFIRFGPGLPGQLEIFDVDRHIAAKFAIEIARHAQDASESERQPALAIQARHGREVRADRFEPGSVREGREGDCGREGCAAVGFARSLAGDL